MIKKVISGLLVTVAVGSAVVGAHDMGEGNKMKKFDSAEHQKVISLIEAGDYDGWKKLMEEQGHEKALEKITAEQFAKMTALAQAVKAKDWEKVKELRKEMPKPPFKKFGKMLKRSQKFENLQKLPESVREQ